MSGNLLSKISLCVGKKALRESARYIARNGEFEKKRFGCPKLSKTAQLGVVARNFSGIMKYCATKVVSGVVSPLQAELLAIRFGLEIGSRMNEEDIVVENDYKLAVDEILKGDSSMCAWGSIVTDITYCSKSFNSCSFAFVVRIINKLAHYLTRIPCGTKQVQVWKDKFPLELCNPDME
ncbi:hypothetical protein DITRI_Ditri16bG0067300 [Diplodiscus trichospermus]